MGQLVSIFAFCQILHIFDPISAFLINIQRRANENKMMSLNVFLTGKKLESPKVSKKTKDEPSVEPSFKVLALLMQYSLSRFIKQQDIILVAMLPLCHSGKIPLADGSCNMHLFLLCISSSFSPSQLFLHLSHFGFLHMCLSVSVQLVCTSLEHLRDLISKTEDELDELESTKKRLVSIFQRSINRCIHCGLPVKGGLYRTTLEVTSEFCFVCFLMEKVLTFFLSSFHLSVVIELLCVFLLTWQGQWYLRREAVKDLHITLIRLLNELLPWEPKLVKAYQRNRYNSHWFTMCFTPNSNSVQL